ncbi:MAG: glycosyltransferase [bacterium]
MINPKVTVLMPVYNAEKFLKEAIDSILSQTYKDFEFLIINDGSIDNSSKILKKYKDSRIKIINHKRNMGLIFSLNEGIKLATGIYIARMDADDISLPLRIAKQVRFMENNPDIAVCGSWIKVFNNSDNHIWKVPNDFETIRCLMLFHSAIYHPTVMIRSEIFKKNTLHYDISFIHAEDYELWIRIMKNFEISNLEEILLCRRIHQNSVGNIYNKIQVENANKVRLPLIHKLGIFPEKKEFKIHETISYSQFKTDKLFVTKADKWLIKLLESNKVKKIYPYSIFARVLAEKWFLVCLHATGLGFWTWKIFWKSSLSRHLNITLKQKAQLAIGCLMLWNNEK